MTTRTHPPCRADHVGSFLRPKRLLDARAQRAAGEITPEQLSEVEDDAIAEIVKFQEDCGLQSVTDGTEELAPPVMRVIDTVRHVKDIQKADFEYLKSRV